MDDNYFCCINFVVWHKQLPEAGKKIGKMVGEYNKAKLKCRIKLTI